MFDLHVWFVCVLLMCCFVCLCCVLSCGSDCVVVCLAAVCLKLFGCAVAVVVLCVCCLCVMCLIVV